MCGGDESLDPRVGAGLPLVGVGPFVCCMGLCAGATFALADLVGFSLLW